MLLSPFFCTVGWFLNDSILTGGRWNFKILSICIFLGDNDIEYSKSFLSHLYFFFGALSSFIVYFLIGFFFLIFSLLSSLCSLGINPVKCTSRKVLSWTGTCFTWLFSVLPRSFWFQDVPLVKHWLYFLSTQNPTNEVSTYAHILKSIPLLFL